MHYMCIYSSQLIALLLAVAIFPAYCRYGLLLLLSLSPPCVAVWPWPSRHGRVARPVYYIRIYVPISISLLLPAEPYPA